MSKIEQRLTDEQMNAVEQATVESGWVGAVIETFGQLGVDLSSDDVGEVKPWDYAIPVDQWQQIGNWIVQHDPGSDIGRVNHLMDWMNKGPSAYEEPQPERNTR